MTNEANSANNIVKQAKQGSVAAIIQVLNEKLADSGVRTRAIFADGILQLLCEAATLDQLDQTILTERIRHILEAIAPRNIRRVNINSRIVREQQLLWLDEINRDPEKQVLWSEEIVLKKPSFVKQLMDDWSDRSLESVKAEITKSVAPKTTAKQREKRQFWRGLAGGAVVSCLFLAGAWMLYDRVLAPKPDATSSTTENTLRQTSTSAANSPASSPKTAISPATDAFADAVRLAEQTSQATQTAKSSAEWLGLASQWQKASDLMAQVPTEDGRHKTAQDRVVAYRQNSEIALQKAKQIQPEATVPTAAN